MMHRISQKAVALLAFFILLPLVPAWAQVESATVVVEGMSWGRGRQQQQRGDSQGGYDS